MRDWRISNSSPFYAKTLQNPSLTVFWQNLRTNTMRKVESTQLELGSVDIGAVHINPKSRDNVPAQLHVHCSLIRNTWKTACRIRMGQSKRMRDGVKEYKSKDRGTAVCGRRAPADCVRWMALVGCEVAPFEKGCQPWVGSVYFDFWTISCRNIPTGNRSITTNQLGLQQLVLVNLKENIVHLNL